MWINRWLPEDFITFALNEVNMSVCVFMASLIFKPTFPLWCEHCICKRVNTLTV